MKLLKRIQYNSPVVLTFALISFAALVSGEMTGGASTIKLFCVYRSSLADPLTYPRFFLHALGHSGYEHYMANMLLMLVIGPPLEEKYGSRSLAAAIVITAFASGVVQWVFFPHTGLLGASGIVFMMITMSSLAGARGGAIPLTLIFVFVFYLGKEVADALTKVDDISRVTHILGGVCGACLGFRFTAMKKTGVKPA
ncbi:MAG: rhomboid family intramembrane serine protease [Oscillospiraceae bacterium]|nr:rhomboid family intramembrane serine protease [Oscillospiraceae bacterium]